MVAATLPPGRLLDTNIVAAALNREEAVLARLEEATLGPLFVPTIVLGELHFGARRSAKTTEHLRRIEDFSAQANVLPRDEQTSSHYGKVKEGLSRKGRPIPENDIWIAAVGVQHALTLVSRDSHFKHVEELEIEVW